MHRHKLRLLSLLATAATAMAVLSGTQGTQPASAQTSTTWVRAYVDPSSTSPSAFGESVYPTTDGGYIVAGTAGVEPQNGWIGKVSASGALQWQDEVGCGASSITSVQQTSDGGYILAGAADTCQPQCAAGGFSSLACAWVVKLGPSGAVQWQDIYPGADQANAWQVRQTSDGGYIVAGSTTDAAGNNYAWVAKLTPLGALQWQRQIGAKPFASAQSVAQTSDGGYIVAGTSGAIGSSSLLAVKLDSSGDIQWQQTFGTGYENLANSVQQTSDGGYIIAGEAITQGSEGNQDDALLMKLGSAGTVQWQNRYDAGLENTTIAASVVQTADGGYAMAGTITFFIDNGSIPVTASWLAKTTATGTVSWQNDYYPVNASTGAPEESTFASLAQTPDGGFVAAGQVGEYNSSNNVWLVKADANGNVAGCAEQHPATTTVQAGTLTASASTFPSVTPATSAIGISGAASTANLVTHSDC